MILNSVQESTSPGKSEVIQPSTDVASNVTATKFKVENETTEAADREQQPETKEEPSSTTVALADQKPNEDDKNEQPAGAFVIDDDESDESDKSNDDKPLLSTSASANSEVKQDPQSAEPAKDEQKPDAPEGAFAIGDAGSDESY